MALTVAACGDDESAPDEADPAEGQPDDIDALYDAAREEGTVNLWLPSTDDGALEAIQEGFSERFPGIEIVPFEINSDEGNPRLIAEAQAGQTLSADAYAVATTGAAPLLERDLLMPFDTWTTLFEIPEEEIFSDGTLVSFYNTVMPLGYNEDLVDEAEVPTSWDELLDPKWKGKILVEARGLPFTVLGTEGEDRMVDFIERLLENDPIYVNGGTTTYQQLAAGEAPLAMGAYLHNYLEDDAGDGVGYVFLDPTRVSIYCMAVPSGSANPNAGQLLAGWIASDEGQETLAEVTSRTAILPGTPQGEAVKGHEDRLTIITPEVTADFEHYEQLAVDTLGARQ